MATLAAASPRACVGDRDHAQHCEGKATPVGRKGLGGAPYCGDVVALADMIT